MKYLNSILEREGKSLSRRMDRFVDKKGSPTGAAIELGFRCNERCRHCFTSGWEKVLKKEKALSSKEIYRLLEEFHNLGMINLTLTGGEPLLNNHIFDYARYASKVGLAVGIKTNAILADKKTSRRLFDSGVMAATVSIYGASSNVHDYITRLKGSYKRTQEGIENLRKVGMEVDLAYILMKHNWYEAVEAFVKAVSSGLKMCFGVHIHGSAQHNPSLNISKNECVDEDFREDFSYFIDFCNLFLNHAYQKKPNTNRPCATATKTFVIDPYGYMFPCLSIIHLRNPDISIRSRSIEEIWYNSELFKRFRNLTWDHLGECGNCKVKMQCKTCYAALHLLYKGHLPNKVRKDKLHCREAEYSVRQANRLEKLFKKLEVKNGSFKKMEKACT